MRYSSFAFILLFSGFVLANTMDFETPMFAPQETGAQELGKSWSCNATDPLELTDKQKAICTYINIQAKKEIPKAELKVSKQKTSSKTKKH